jgi:recombinational DNA repair protein RecT
MSPEDIRKVRARKFRADAASIASGLLKDWVGEERAAEAIGRVSVALAASAASSKKPEEFWDCTPESVGRVIAISALTGIMPSTGATALAYAIPRRARQGEPPQLQYQLSHRGIAALAKRSGLHLLAIPIGHNDTIEPDANGVVRVLNRDFDNPPIEEKDLRGVQVLVRDIETGHVLASEFLAKKIIDKRRSVSDSYQFAEKPRNEWAKESSPWHVWYVEMAMKTAMHYAISRGWCVVDDTEAVRALSIDASEDVVRTIEGSAIPAAKGLAALEAKIAPPSPSEQIAAVQEEVEAAQ